MLQSSYLLVAPCLAQPTVYLQSVGQVKRFIERLSQYIAPGRLTLKPPWYLPHGCVSWMTFVTPRGVSFPSNPFNFSSIALTLSCIFFFLVLVKSGLLSNCQFNFSSFFLKTAASLSMFIVKVTILTPVCWQAFDVANIWVKVSIRSRSNQSAALWCSSYCHPRACRNGWKDHPCCKALQSCTLSERSKPTHTVLLLLLLFHVEMVEIYIQYSSINDVIFNPKFSNKDAIQLIVWITTEFELRCPETSIYKEFEQS